MSISRLTLFAIAIAIFVIVPSVSYSQNNVDGKTRNIHLSAPEPGLTGVYGPAGGEVSIYPAGSLPGAFATDFPDNMFYRVHNLACRTGWYTPALELSAAAREFYVLYLIIDNPEQRIRVQTFNTVCSSGGGGGFAGNGSFSNFAYLGGEPFVLEDALEGLFTSDITVEVYLERDDGGNAPDNEGDLLVLTGTDRAPVP